MFGLIQTQSSHCYITEFCDKSVNRLKCTACKRSVWKLKEYVEECAIISRDRMNDEKKRERPRELSEAINKHEISFLSQKNLFYNQTFESCCSFISILEMTHFCNTVSFSKASNSAIYCSKCFNDFSIKMSVQESNHARLRIIL